MLTPKFNNTISGTPDISKWAVLKTVVIIQKYKKSNLSSTRRVENEDCTSDGASAAASDRAYQSRGTETVDTRCAEWTC